MDHEHADDIVRIAHASSAAEAHIWQNALESEGIECKVVGDFLEGGMGYISGLLPEIWVHEDDVLRATAILQEHQAMAKARGDEDYDDDYDEGDENEPETGIKE